MSSNQALKPQPPPITPLEFDAKDFPKAEALAKALGYEQTAYTSTSTLWGLFCLPENPATHHGLFAPTRGGCVIKTAQFGLLFVQDTEDITGEVDSLYMAVEGPSVLAVNALATLRAENLALREALLTMLNLEQSAALWEMRQADLGHTPLNVAYHGDKARAALDGKSWNCCNCGMPSDGTAHDAGCATLKGSQ